MDHQMDHQGHEKCGRGRILFKEECYSIQGAVFEVYRVMGSGFLEAVYQECMEKELFNRGIPFVTQRELKLNYKGTVLDQTFRPDLVCYDSIIVELKALKELSPQHEAQALNYLKASRMQLALVVNFGSYPKATIKRIAL